MGEKHVKKVTTLLVILGLGLFTIGCARACPGPEAVARAGHTGPRRDHHSGRDSGHSAGRSRCAREHAQRESLKHPLISEIEMGSADSALPIFFAPSRICTHGGATFAPCRHPLPACLPSDRIAATADALLVACPFASTAQVCGAQSLASAYAPMAQIFHPSTNTFAKATIFGAVFVLAAVAWAGGVFVRSSYVTRPTSSATSPSPSATSITCGHWASTAATAITRWNAPPLPACPPPKFAWAAIRKSGETVRCSLPCGRASARASRWSGRA